MIHFFRSHRFVRGSISILLALLLMPMYMLIAVIIETARYRSAQEQLSELTFMGEMAILADYVDFLANDYGLYAFSSSGVKDSFKKYMDKVESAGGVDTRKLNTLFGVDMEKCDIRYMYSIVDPDVLSYQVRQYGRYAMPIDVFNEFLLSDLLKKVSKLLSKVNSRLSVIKNCATAVEEATGVIAEYRKMRSALADLTVAQTEVDNCKDDMLNGKNTVDWNVINEPLFPEIYNIWTEDRDKIDVIQDELTQESDLMFAMENLKEGMYTYFSSPGSSENQSITLDQTTADYLGITTEDGSAEVSDVLSKINYKLGESGISSVSDKNGYDTAIETLRESTGTASDIIDLYERSTPLFTFCSSYQEKYYSSVTNLQKEYSEYIGSVKAMITSFDSIVSNIDQATVSVEAMEYDSLIKDLNEEGESARDIRAEFEESRDALEKDSKVTQEDVDKTAQKRRAAYQKAKESRDYAGVGTCVVEKFCAEVEENVLEMQVDNFKEKTGNLPNFSGLNNVEEFKERVGKLQRVDFTVQYTEKWDFYSQHGREPFDLGEYTDTLNELVTTYDKDPKDAMKKEWTLNLGGIYDIFINPPVGSGVDDLGERWFGFESGKSYYFSKQTVLILFGFLIGSTFITGGSDGNKILDALKTVFDYIQRLYPDDRNLNNHIGDKSNKRTLTCDYGTYPSAGPYYIGRDASSDSEEVLTRSTAFSDNYISGAEGFDLNKYYTHKTTSSNLYDRIFGNRQPGEGIEQLVSGVSGVINHGSNFIEYVQNFSIWKVFEIFKEMAYFIGSVVTLVSGLINFVIDLVQLISMMLDDAINNTHETLDYVFDQLYIGYYARTFFTSRQTAPGGDGDVNPLQKNHCGTNCFDDKVTFDGAEMEYILGGSPCEIENQHTAFYAVMMIRFLLNFAVVAADEFAQTVSSIPYVGPILLVLLVLGESNLDMMFLVGGVKVPLVKTKMSLSPTNIDSFFSQLKEMVEKTEQKKMEWTMAKTEKGNTYRKYKNSNQTASAMINTAVKDNLLGGGVFPIDYEMYINLLLLFYRESTKLGRIADLLQMHGMTEKDYSFRLEDCYTYVYADVNADYKPLLPMITSDENQVFPDLYTVVVNGY